MKKLKNFIDIHQQILLLKNDCGIGEIASFSIHNVKFNSAMNCLKKIIENADRETIQNQPEINDLTSCCLILIQIAIAKFQLKSIKFHSSRQLIMKARRRFCALLTLIFPERVVDVIHVVLNFLRDHNLWLCEILSVEYLQCLLLSRAPCEIVFEKILNATEEMIVKNQIDEARCAVGALNSSISIEYFRELTANGLIRLLSLYHLSVELTDSKNKLHLLKSGFELMLKKIFGIMSIEELTNVVPKFFNLTFENELSSKMALTEFGLTIREAFVRLSSHEIEKNLKPEILEYFLISMNLKCEVKSLFACQYLSIFIDHLKNFNHFLTPKIFHQNNSYRIKISKESHESLIECKRELIEASFLSAIKMHGWNKNNLDAFYNVICIIIVTLPSPTTNIMFINTLMELQNFIINEKQSNLSSFNKNQIHAFIISIMTFICWTTRAKTLTKYINEIVNARYNLAPHLLPPLKEFYDYEHHHVLAFKSELFLDTNEMRYCLWKFYRLNETHWKEDSDDDARKFMKRKKKEKISGFKFSLFHHKSIENYFKLRE